MPPMFDRSPRAGRSLVLTLTLAFALSACSTAAPTATATRSPTPSPVPTPSATASPSPTATPTPAPTAAPLDQALLGRRLTVLIAGIDSNPDRAARDMPLNTDAMIVASVNAAHDRIAMVSLPRDTVDLPLAGGGVWPRKINSLFAVRGIKALRGALATTYGVPIDYYLTLNMSDFGALVDAVGGVTVDVPYAIYDQTVQLNLKPGKHRFNGNAALSYVRTRHQDGDFARQGRQQQVLMAIVRKLVDPGTTLDIRALLRSFGSLKTDLPLEEIATLREIGARSADAKVTRRVLGPAYARFMGIEPNSPRGWIIIPNVAKMRAYVQSAMRD
jgi:polyisoprenyl-teichoic acid--peptidoglycan teichoic acid transferase